MNFQFVADDAAISTCCTSITQDQSGFIWLGSQRGLYRFDGYEFKRYIHDPNQRDSLAGDFVYSLWSAADGKIWIGTINDGVSTYHPETDSFSHYRGSKESNTGLLNNEIRTITGDNKGNIFVGTNEGLSHINVETREITNFKDIQGCPTAYQTKQIRSLVYDEKGTLWMGTTSGLCRLTLPELRKSLSAPNWIDSVRGEEWSDFNSQTVYRLFKSRDNKIWVGTRSHGAASINIATGEIIRIPYSPDSNEALGHGWVFAITQPNDTDIWIGTFGGGIDVVDAKSGKVNQKLRHDASNERSLSSDYIGALLTDESGLIWVGTWGNGLRFYNTHNNAFRTLRHSPYKPMSLSNSDISAMIELKNGDVWIGNRKTGIDILKPGKGLVKGIRPNSESNLSLPDGFIRVLLQTSDGAVWIGTFNSGLYRYTESEPELESFAIDNKVANIQISALYETPDKHLWVGTNYNIAKIDLTTLQFTPLKQFENIDLVRNKGINSFKMTKDGVLWIGTQNGLFALLTHSNKLLPISFAAGTTNILSDNTIESLVIDNEGTLFVGTSEEIVKLVSFDNSKAVFESVSNNIDTPDFNSSNLMVDQFGKIWHAEGWLNPKEKTFQSLSEEDGWTIGSNWSGSYYQMRDGTLLFGGTEGLLMVEPELLKPWDFQPNLVISQLEVNNKITTIPQKLTLTPDTQSFSVQFSALDYSAPGKITYAYRLEGYDNDWVETNAGNRRATYTNLPPGNYTLKVKGTNRHGKWSDKRVKFAIVQQPAWNETWWFKLMLLLAFSGLTYFISWARSRSLEKQKAELNHLVQLRTLELEEKNKQLETASLTDQLTGAKNRHFFERFIHQEIKQQQRTNENPKASTRSCIGIMIVDADHFKQVNDVHGHNAGDQVLIQLTQVLQNCCRENDWVIRWGGEEFLIVCRSTTLSALQELAERIRKAIEFHDFNIGEGKTLKKTCSIGLCECPFIEGEQIFTIEQTLHMADLALYMAKSNGRNAWVSISNLAEHPDASTKQIILEDIEGATDKGYLQITSSIKRLNKNK
ncbi:ligand-binding sensor domain-containing diguanylate cyclase [Pleionea sediminis]|uniref:ligand-binding sensor domain-containing diguanylate cyclase n=1 Tax=Pleionea sediminis TaxID=2569479 RepID=UPI0013DDC334|nr:ligand-binding sensor domain-containing diguanylate cyclase [Pleionea sediminis]